MKIVIDCRMIGSGGIGSYLLALLPYFIKEHECVLLVDSNKLDKYSNNKNVTLLKCNIKTFSFKELFFFPKNLLKIINNCDLYYSPYFNIPSGIKIPIYTTIHDVVFLDIKNLASKTGTFIRKLFYKHAINKSKSIFTVSNFSAERIKYNLKCKKNIIVTYNAVPDWFESKNQTEKILKEDTFLFVGNIKKHKGLHLLLDAFILAKNEGLTSKLKIVGNAENFRTSDDTILSLLEKLPKDAVEFTGKISDEELKNLYKKSKALIQPSFYEGFGMPPLEAMSLGTNVIMSDIPVFKEIYKDFPVIFYSSNDKFDLQKKLLASNNLPEVKIPNIYSFEKTYNIIKSELEKL